MKTENWFDVENFQDGWDGTTVDPIFGGEESDLPEDRIIDRGIYLLESIGVTNCEEHGVYFMLPDGWELPGYMFGEVAAWLFERGVDLDDDYWNQTYPHHMKEYVHCGEDN